MGGLLFGYDWVVIGGAKPFYELFFGISDDPVMQGWAMSSAILGCLIDAVSAGAMADRYGRKPLLIIAAIIFFVSAVATGAFNVARKIPAKDALRDIVDKYSDRSNPFFFLIKNPNLLAEVNMRRLIRPAAAYIGFKDANDGNNRWFVGQSAIKVDTRRWMPLQPFGTHCLYTRHLRFDVTIAIYSNPQAAMAYRIEVQPGKNPGDDQLVAIDMSTLAQLLPQKFSLSHNRYFASFADTSSAIAALHTVLKSL